MAEGKCACETLGVMLYTCAGSANVGLLSHDVVRELAAQGKGKMGCLTGIGGHVPTMVLNAKAAGKILMVDGCQVGCGAKALQEAGITDFEHVVISDLGVKKSSDLTLGMDMKEDIVRRITEGHL